MDRAVNDVVSRLQEILQNPHDEPIDLLGAYIVGATLARDDIEQHFLLYPLLEEIAELGADLEVLGGSVHAASVLAEINLKFDALQTEVRDSQSH